MDTAKWEFTATAKKLLKQLDEISHQLLSLRQEINQHAGAIRDHDERAEQQAHAQPPIQVLAELHSPENVERQHQANDDRHHRLQWWLTVGTWLAFGAAAVYAGIAAKQLRQMKIATKATQDAAKAASDSVALAKETSDVDQRAWVSPHIIHQIFAERQPLVISTQFSNTGKTPAIKVRTCQVAEIVESTRENIEISCPESSRSPREDIIFPQGYLFRTSNASGQGGKANIDKEGLLRKPLMNELRRWDKFVYIYGRVDYSDMFNNPHWSTFCSMMRIMPPTPGGLRETISWESCANGNNIDTEIE